MDGLFGNSNNDLDDFLSGLNSSDIPKRPSELHDQTADDEPFGDFGVEEDFWKDFEIPGSPSKDKSPAQPQSSLDKVNAIGSGDTEMIDCQDSQPLHVENSGVDILMEQQMPETEEQEPPLAGTEEQNINQDDSHMDADYQQEAAQPDLPPTEEQVASDKDDSEATLDLPDTEGIDDTTMQEPEVVASTLLKGPLEQPVATDVEPLEHQQTHIAEQHQQEQAAPPLAVAASQTPQPGNTVVYPSMNQVLSTPVPVAAVESPGTGLLALDTPVTNQTSTLSVATTTPTHSKTSSHDDADNGVSPVVLVSHPILTRKAPPGPSRLARTSVAAAPFVPVAAAVTTTSADTHQYQQHVDVDPIGSNTPTRKESSQEPTVIPVAKVGSKRPASSSPLHDENTTSDKVENVAAKPVGLGVSQGANLLLGSSFIINSNKPKHAAPVMVKPLVPQKQQQLGGLFTNSRSFKSSMNANKLSPLVMPPQNALTKINLDTATPIDLDDPLLKFEYSTTLLDNHNEHIARDEEALKHSVSDVALRLSAQCDKIHQDAQQLVKNSDNIKLDLFITASRSAFDAAESGLEMDALIARALKVLDFKVKDRSGRKVRFADETGGELDDGGNGGSGFADKSLMSKKILKKKLTA